MSFPKLYSAIRKAAEDLVTHTNLARDMARKADIRSLEGEQTPIPAPILSVPGSRRVCLDPGEQPVAHCGFQGWNAILDSSGQLYRWGAGGDKNDTEFDLVITTPTRILDYLTDTTHMADNEFYLLLRQGNGNVWANTPVGGVETGDADFRQLTEFNSAVMVAGSQGLINNPGQCYILKTDGTVWALGVELPGMGTDPNPYSFPGAWSTNILEFQQMPTAKLGTGVIDICASPGRLSWRRSDGAIGTWVNSVQNPVFPTSRPANVAKMTCGSSHLLVRTTGGEIWSAGGNQDGEAGLLASSAANPGGSSNNYAAFRKALSDGYTDVAGLGRRTLAVKGGRMWTWGLGGSLSARNDGLIRWGAPVEITNPNINDVTRVHGGDLSYNGMYTSGVGCTYIWGHNWGGSLGQGYQSPASLPGFQIEFDAYVPIQLPVGIPVAPWPV